MNSGERRIRDALERAQEGVIEGKAHLRRLRQNHQAREGLRRDRQRPRRRHCRAGASAVHLEERVHPIATTLGPRASRLC
jgi:hypothetical protein